MNCKIINNPEILKELTSGSYLRLDHNAYLYQTLSRNLVVVGNIELELLSELIIKNSCRNWFLTEGLTATENKAVLTEFFITLLRSEKLTKDDPFNIVVNNGTNRKSLEKIFFESVEDFHQSLRLQYKDKPLLSLMIALKNFTDENSYRLVKLISGQDASFMEWKPGQVTLEQSNSGMLLKDYSLYEKERYRQIREIMDSAGWLGSFKDLPEALSIKIQ